MRSVGLTIKEIKRLADAFLADRDEPIGPKVAAALDRAEQRVETQLQELEALRRRIAAYRADNAAALRAARTSPRPIRARKTRLDSAPGVRAYGSGMRRLTAALEDANCARGYTAEIGPIAALARVAIGMPFILLALFWNDPTLADPLVGLVVMPHVVTGLLALRAPDIGSARCARPARSATSPTPRSASRCSRIPGDRRRRAAVLRRLDAGRGRAALGRLRADRDLQRRARP